MQPIFFSNRVKMIAIMSFTEEIRHTQSLIISKLYAKNQSEMFLSDPSFHQLLTKINAFNSEFFWNIENNKLGVTECTAYSLCASELKNLQRTLLNLEENFDPKSIDPNLNMFKLQMQKFLSFEVECEKT